MTERVIRRDLVQNLALALFLCTGLAIPFFAFPIFRAAGRPVDFATLFAGLFLAASLLAFRLRRGAPGIALAAAALAAALLVVIEPRPPRFDASRFAASFGHWALVVGVFAGASLLAATPRARVLIACANGLMGAAVAAFGLYQVIGHPLGWPGTGSMLVPSQREPLRFLPLGNSSYMRPTSVFLEPAWLGGYLAFILALLFGLLSAGVVASRAGRVAVGASLILVLLCGLATVSWGAYADLAAVVLAGIWGLRERLRATPRAAGAVIVVLAIILSFGIFSPTGRGAANAAAERLRRLLETPVGEKTEARDVSDSSWIRFENLRHTTELIREFPGRGVGLGQFGLYAKKEGPSDLAVSATRDPWCGWLAIAAEVGLLGPPILALFLLLVVWRRSAASRRDETPGGALARVTAPALILLAVVQQLHTASYIDLWWWYPVSVAMVLSAPAAEPPPAILKG